MTTSEDALKSNTGKSYRKQEDNHEQNISIHYHAPTKHHIIATKAGVQSNISCVIVFIIPSC